MLREWSSFFAMTGAAGATLVGLLFVVVTLGTGLPTSRTMDIARASMTPALYSFSEVLLQSMVALVPWPADWPSGAIFAAIGINGVIYRIRAIRLRNALHLKAISGPIDWIFHNLVSLAAGVSLISGGGGVDRWSGLQPVRHRRREHAPAALRDLPDVGSVPGFVGDAGKVVAPKRSALEFWHGACARPVTASAV